MRQKLITLCPNSFEIAQKKPNFSAWVRKKLLEEAQSNEMGVVDNSKYRYKCLCCTQIITRLDRKPIRCPNHGCAMLTSYMKYMGVDE